MEEEKFKLFTEIKKVSQSKKWDEVKKEWKFVSVYFSEEPQACLCGKFPIKEICILENIKNDNEVEVGNICVNKFLEIEAGFIVEGIKKLNKDISKSISKKLIKKIFDDGIINDWEHEFYNSIWRKRNLTEKQKNIKKKINKKVLTKYLTENN